MIEVYKILTERYCKSVNLELELYKESVTRGHSQHCKEKINKANAMLGKIKRNFIYLSEEAFVSLYKTLVRSHLEYANSVWTSYRMGLILRT